MSKLPPLIDPVVYSQLPYQPDKDSLVKLIQQTKDADAKFEVQALSHLQHKGRAAELYNCSSCWLQFHHCMCGKLKSVTTRHNLIVYMHYKGWHLFKRGLL